MQKKQGFISSPTSKREKNITPDGGGGGRGGGRFGEREATIERQTVSKGSCVRCIQEAGSLLGCGELPVGRGEGQGKGACL